MSLKVFFDTCERKPEMESSSARCLGSSMWGTRGRTVSALALEAGDDVVPEGSGEDDGTCKESGRNSDTSEGGRVRVVSKGLQRQRKAGWEVGLVTLSLPELLKDSFLSRRPAISSPPSKGSPDGQRT